MKFSSHMAVKALGLHRKTSPLILLSETTPDYFENVTKHNKANFNGFNGSTVHF